MRWFTYKARGLPGLLLPTGTAAVFLSGGDRVVDPVLTRCGLHGMIDRREREVRPAHGPIAGDDRLERLG